MDAVKPVLAVMENLSFWANVKGGNPAVESALDIFGLTKLSNAAGVVTVSGLTRNSPAFNAGINVDDEILAIDGYRLKSSDVSSLIKSVKPGETKECLIVRRGKILKKQVKFDARPSSSWSLTRVSKLTKSQTGSRSSNA